MKRSSAMVAVAVFLALVAFADIATSGVCCADDAGCSTAGNLKCGFCFCKPIIVRDQIVVPEREITQTLLAGTLPEFHVLYRTSVYHPPRLG